MHQAIDGKDIDVVLGCLGRELELPALQHLFVAPVAQ